MDNETTAHAASTLCQQCGLCCAGLLFEHVNFRENELQNIEGVAFKVIEPGKKALPHPCQFLDGTRCSIYVDRPSNCKSFACVARREVLNGKLALNDGAALVQQIKAYLLQLNPIALELTNSSISELGFRDFCAQFIKTMEKKVRNGTLPSQDEQAAVKVCFEAVKIVDRHFRKTRRLNKFADILLSIENLAIAQADWPKTR